MATLRKYAGDPDPRTEALEIKINRSRQLIRDAQRRIRVKSGMADKDIVAPHAKGTLPVPKSVGKYFGRLTKTEDDMAFESLPGILNTLFKNKQMSNNDFDVQAHHQRMLTTGPFADAAKRHSVWEPAQPAQPLQVAQALPGNMYDAETLRKMGVDPNTVRANPKLQSKPTDQNIVMPQGSTGEQFLKDQARKDELEKQKRIKAMTGG